MRKRLVICLSIIIVLAGAFFYCEDWWGKKKIKIQMGQASPDFPWSDYSQK
ncbi:MAG: hypothetical protein PHQ47_01695 [Candidatus Portnoybacteria bacterium]|nr:hypothetical protein [Candidatus Portnoybacteria bacterium]